MYGCVKTEFTLLLNAINDDWFHEDTVFWGNQASSK